ncbi:ATP-binding protein [Haliangium sp.]|uniref:ATP-binding protein n=1 Tax=Haliangium sp. TaxID=2663208 RepID=UPI003D0E58FD
MRLGWNTIGGRLFLVFAGILAVNAAALILVTELQHRQERFDAQVEGYHTIEVEIEAYLHSIQALATGLFASASGHPALSRALVLEAEKRAMDIERRLDELPWEQSVIGRNELAPCLSIRQAMSAEARTIEALLGEGGGSTPAQQRRHRERLRVALSRVAIRTEHANLYVIDIVSRLRAHATELLSSATQLAAWIGRVTIIAGGLGLGTALLLGLMFARWLGSQLAALRDVTRAIADGDLSRRSGIRSNDEIGGLARAFDHMAERLQAQAGVRVSKAYVDNIIETMTNGLVVLDQSGYIEKVNPAACALLGYRQPELIGLPAERILGPQGVGEGADAAQPWQGQAVREVEHVLMTKSGEPRTVSLSSAVMDASSGRKTVYVLDDISERRELFAQLVEAKRVAERATKAKTAFLADMSHELRTPLNAILGYAQMLAEDCTLGERQRAAVATMGASGQHLVMLLEDLLDISKIEAGRMELSPAGLHLGRFLDELSAPFGMRAQAKGLGFAYRRDPELPTAVFADERRLRQVLLNLLSNAIRYTETGRVQFSVDRLGERVRFRVEDSGVGIPSHLHAAIFEPFHQVGAARPYREGSGLGLAISKRLVELMAGTLEVHSVPGEGSVFVVELVLPVIAEWSEGSQPRPGRSGYTGPRRQVLIVDDEVENRVMLRSYLSGLGFGIDEAGDGREAVARAAMGRPNVVLMDLRMPGMGGLEATRALRAGGDRVPIIAISASAFAENQAESLRAGCNAFLAKPVRLDALSAKLEELLGLTWTYAEAAGDSEGAEGGTERVLPPAEELDCLLALSRGGDIQAVRRRVEELAEREPAYADFVAVVRRFVKQYRLRELRTHLAMCLEQATAGD